MRAGTPTPYDISRTLFIRITIIAPPAAQVAAHAYVVHTYMTLQNYRTYSSYLQATDTLGIHHHPPAMHERDPLKGVLLPYYPGAKAHS
ncbi:hypothetical protein K474DRAFT_1708956 [Panus rudis PR-1116 ss-1]|nr:hypothetical protein K474DRAFT_1708956 [Panus rudis PR-1116 ss-1]